MIAAEHQRNFSILRGFLDDLGQPRTSVRDGQQVTGIGGTDGRIFGLIDGDIAEILDRVSERCEFFIEPGQAQRGRPHIDAAASGAQIHGRSDDGDVRLPHTIPEIRIRESARCDAAQPRNTERRSPRNPTRLSRRRSDRGNRAPPICLLIVRGHAA